MKPMPMVELFVYGTLKRGYWNHTRFCQGLVAAEKAFVCGTLYETSFGLPVLRVPEETILAHGTSDPIADAQLQDQAWSIDAPVSKERVQGEVLTFDDPDTRLPRIDQLESFRPGDYSGYRRVLVPAFSEHGTYPVWCYVAGERFQELKLLRLAGEWDGGS